MALATAWSPGLAAGAGPVGGERGGDPVGQRAEEQRAAAVERLRAPPRAPGVIVISPGSGSSSGAVSAGASTSQPSPPGSAPAPDQTTSPAAVSSSSRAGE